MYMKHRTVTKLFKDSNEYNAYNLEAKNLKNELFPPLDNFFNGH